MSLLERAWRGIRPPVSFVALFLGAMLGITSLGMLARGIFVEGAVQWVELLGTLGGSGLLLLVGLALRKRLFEQWLRGVRAG